jgi:hypothetical protein
VRPVRRLVVLLAAIGLLAAGCGGGSSSSSTTTGTGPPLTKAEYQKKLAQTSAEISAKLGSTGNDIDKMTTEELGKLTAALHEFADRIRAINPPAAVKELNARLATAMDEIGDEFPGIASRLKKTKDPSEAITIFFGAKGFQELIALGQEFKDKGYDLSLGSQGGTTTTGP